MSRRVALAVSAALVVLIALLAIVAGSGTAAAAQQNNTTTLPPYYENNSTANESAWFGDDANMSLDSMVGMATRLGPYVVGTGQQIPGGVGYAGPVITGLIVAGVFIGSVAGTGMGSEAGSVIALTTAYGLVEVGLAPEWFKVVVLMLLGLVAGVVVIRATK